VYGPVRTVVWEGRSCEAPPYPDRSDFVRWPISEVAGRLIEVSSQRYSGPDLLTLSFSQFDPNRPFRHLDRLSRLGDHVILTLGEPGRRYGRRRLAAEPWPRTV
jgi:hypothetical protein